VRWPGNGSTFLYKMLCGLLMYTVEPTLRFSLLIQNIILVFNNHVKLQLSVCSWGVGGKDLNVATTKNSSYSRIIPSPA